MGSPVSPFPVAEMLAGWGQFICLLTKYLGKARPWKWASKEKVDRQVAFGFFKNCFFIALFL